MEALSTCNYICTSTGDAQNSQSSHLEMDLVLLILQSIALPRNVVVRIHNREDRVPDEGQQEQQPVGQVLEFTPLGIPNNERHKGYDGCGLRDVSLTTYLFLEMADLQS